MPDTPLLDIKAIQDLRDALAALPDALAKPTKRAVVALLAGDIHRARAKGYTLKQIAQHLQQRGFAINYHTLRDALPRQKTSRAGKRKSSRLRADAPRLEPQRHTRERVPRADVPVTAPPRAADGSAPVEFPAGAACVFTGDGRFIPAPDSEEL